MSLLDLECQDSISCSMNCPYIVKNGGKLLLGKSCFNNYMIYLHFNLPEYSYLKYLKQARLILFKLPPWFLKCQVEQIDENSLYDVYPLLDFFNIYSYMVCKPTLDYERMVSFKNLNCGYTEIDITSIVKAWIQEEIENKGLILMGNNHFAKLISYVNNHDMIGICPRLRLLYDENHICPPLSCTPSCVEIDC